MSKARESLPWAPSRRDFLLAAGISAAELNTVWATATAAPAPLAPRFRQQLGAQQRPYNILLIVNDQEHYVDRLPPGYSLPGRERMEELGTSFTNHQIASCVCTSSRSNIYTGQHIQQTGMFDNLKFPWINSMSTDVPTLGHMMRELGYYSAYQGKWHLARELEGGGPAAGQGPQFIGRDVMEGYGFSDYTGIGDIIGTTLGGYLNDAWIAAFSNRWLRERGTVLNAEGQPWFLAVNLVNPHDVMYYNTDLPGEPVQEQPWTSFTINRAPDYDIYRQEWDQPLPVTRNQSWDLSNRPQAHLNFQEARGALVGQFPSEDDRWKRLRDYYLNCIQDVDRHIHSVIDEVEALGMLENTIIVRTSDHGELAGAHEMHGKGSTAYKDQNHVPLIVVHPDVTGGRTCEALTSHLDLVPALVSMAQGDASRKSDILDRLKGRDFSRLLNDPVGADVNELREATLYNFNMLVFQDPAYVIEVVQTLHDMGKEEGQADLRRRGLQPDLGGNRGAIRSVFDGRYKFSRYFSTLEHNRPETLEELIAVNDIELFDHESDPEEAVNLAADLVTNGDLVLAMNAKLNAIINEEVGVDDGSSLGLDEDTDYAFTEVDI